MEKAGDISRKFDNFVRGRQSKIFLHFFEENEKNLMYSFGEMGLKRF